jgi:hypothetical protein
VVAAPRRGAADAQWANGMPGGAVALMVYAGGFNAGFWLPEPQQTNLPDWVTRVHKAH